MRKETTMKRLNKLNASDKMVENVIGAIAEEMDRTDQTATQVIADTNFDSCSSTMLEFYEKEAGIKPLVGQGIDDRRSAVEAKWKSTGKIDIQMLQAVADSWQHGKVDVDFVDNKIQITFVDQFGLPSDRTGLELALDEVKPAHLPIIYFVLYLMVEDVQGMTLDELQSHTLSDFSFE